MKKYLFLDVDGTLIDYKLELPHSAWVAVTKAQEKGNEIILCTGCSPSEVESRNLNFTYDGIISGNGCYVEYKNQVIFQRTLSLEQIKRIISWCDEKNLPFHFETNHGMYARPSYRETSRKAMYEYRFGKNAQMPQDYSPAFKGMIFTEDLWMSDVNKVDFILSSYQDYLEAKALFTDCHVSHWGGEGESAIFGDFGVEGITKAQGVQMMLDHLSATKENTYGFGDSAGDLPMFEKVGTSIAMGNGGQQCKDAADYITDDINQDGLYNAFKKFELL